MRSFICLIILLSVAAPALADEPAEIGGVPVVDRVKSVQKKPFIKKGRVEITPSFVASANDAFFQKVGGGVQLAYHLADAFALRAHYQRFSTVRTDNVRIAKRDLHSRLLFADLEQLWGGDFAWTPVYGKLAVLGGKIAYFDLYLTLGFGAAVTDSTERTHLATALGGGARFFLASWLAADLSLTDTIYRERFTSVSGAPLSDIQNAVMVGGGLSVFFPFSFKYEAAQ